MVVIVFVFGKVLILGHLNDHLGVVMGPLSLAETLLHQDHLDGRPTNWRENKSDGDLENRM